MTVTPSTWSPRSWRERTALQQPDWPDGAAVEAAVERLTSSPPLVFAGEARALRDNLAKVIDGRAFLLQAGDCVESFNEISTMRIREKLKIMLQMSAVLTYGATLPVVKVGRIAGQFTKPRSEPFEEVGGEQIPSFRGHMIHDDARTAEARIPDPRRMVEGYNQSASTLNLLRAFTKGGYADLTQVHLWNKDFVSTSPEGQRYDQLAGEIERALAFMAACGIDLANERRLHEVDVFTSHEGLLLDYEEGLTRRDSITGDWYDCSAHLLWIGERTRQIDGAHVEFFSGVHNPIGVKIGPAATPAEVVELAERLNPLRVPGRLTYYARMGAGRRASDPLGVRSDARERDPYGGRGEDASFRRDHERARGLLQRLLGGRRVAGRRASGVHGRGRHRMPRRRRRRARGAPRVALPDPARPAAECTPVARPRVPPGRVDARAALIGWRNLIREANQIPELVVSARNS
jgi:3-deoxy-7-phosphoheptulonate synthase